MTANSNEAPSKKGEPEAKVHWSQTDFDLIDECLDLYAQRIDHGSGVEQEGCCYGHGALIDARAALARLAVAPETAARNPLMEPAALLALLRRIEWVPKPDWDGSSNKCPDCDEHETYIPFFKGHHRDCILSATIAALEAAPTSASPTESETGSDPK